MKKIIIQLFVLSIYMIQSAYSSFEEGRGGFFSNYANLDTSMTNRPGVMGRYNYTVIKNRTSKNFDPSEKNIDEAIDDALANYDLLNKANDMQLYMKRKGQKVHSKKRSEIAQLIKEIEDLKQDFIHNTVPDFVESGHSRQMIFSKEEAFLRHLHEISERFDANIC